MNDGLVTRLPHLIVLWLLGCAGLAAVTGVCFWLGLNLATTAFAYLIVIVLLSLMDSLITSAIFSVVAVGLLNFFFVEPLFSFRIEYVLDITALVTFVGTALVVTSLVRRLRDLGRAQREQGRLLDVTRDAVVVRDVNDAITYWNRGAEELYGWRREDALGKVTHQLLQTIFPQPLDEIRAKLLHDGHWEGELVHAKRDGTRATIESRWSLRRDENGEPTGTLESNNDITERKRAEEALRASQAAYLTEAQQLSHTGSFGWNAATGDLFWSEETFRIFGYDAATRPTIEMVVQRVHPDDLDRVRQVIDRAAGEARDFDFEHRLLMPDRSVKHLHVVAHAAAAGVPQFVGAVMDVTARKETEEALRYSEYRYHNLFGAMAASFWELDFSAVTGMLRALKKSGVEDFRTYFDANPAYVREMMRASRVIDVNDETVKLFGRGSKEELLTNVEPFWPEESTHVYAESILQSIAGKPNYSTECKLRRIDGTTFDALFTAAFPPGTLSKGALVVGVIDITARKKAFAELEAGEQRYRYLFHYMPMSLTQLDASKLVTLFKGLRAQGVTDLHAYIDEHPDFLWRATDALVVEEVNDHNARMFGAPSPKDMHGPITRYWQARPDTIRRALEARYRGEEYFQEETQVVKFDGQTIDVLFSTARPAPVNDKSLVGFLDITALKQAHAAVEQSELRYRSLFHHMPIPLWRTNSTGLIALLKELRDQGVTDLAAYLREHPDFSARTMEKVVIAEVNESAARLFGAREPRELLETMLAYWRANPQSYDRILAARYRGEEVYGEQTKLTTADGRAIEGLYFVAFPPQLSALGITINAFIDATERVRAEDMLQKVQAEFAHAARVSMLGELTASIAHEVNQPLAAITTNGEAGLRWLNRTEPNLGEARELMKRVVTDARRAADIITRVRGMASRGAYTRVPISLHQVIQEALLFLGHEIQSRGVSVRLIHASSLPDVRADRTQMQQVIVNLAVNAMQAMAHAGTTSRTLGIRTTRPDATSVCCIIEDSGPGIDDAHLDRLFESFFTTKESGMGMGLPICRSIIEAHGGRVEADNASAYGGARFAFTLPTAEASQY